MKKSPTAPTRAILNYYGSKWKLAEWIISFFPDHTNYVEPCGGAAAVLLQKPRSKLETYNDLEGHVVNFFKMLRDRPDDLIRIIRLTPWARAEYEDMRLPSDDPLENARRFFCGCRMSISSMPFEKSTGFRTRSNKEQCYSTHVQIFTKLVDGDALYKVADRFKNVQIESKDALYIIKRYDYETALIYFDPPYVTETRVAKDQYLLETTNDLHIQAAELLRKAKGYVVVSGYACDLYSELYESHGWVRHDKKSQVNCGKKKTESLWVSPRTMEALSKPKQLSF